MNPNSSYPSLPEGRIVCEACANTGKKIEMGRYSPEGEHAAKSELASYRCPECESISVFQVD